MLPLPHNQLDKALEIYQEMLRQNMDRSVITYSSLISACEKAGQVGACITCNKGLLFGHRMGCVTAVHCVFK